MENMQKVCDAALDCHTAISGLLRELEGFVYDANKDTLKEAISALQRFSECTAVVELEAKKFLQNVAGVESDVEEVIAAEEENGTRLT
jgi:hypothetical protein